MINTASWYLIINTIGDEHGVCRKCKVGFWWLYKITVSAFALNYATPGGLMGGEPYRIMSLSPKIGGQRASSSVILFVMTHIYSHFWFWFLSVPLYVLTQKMTPLSYILLPIIAAISLLAIWFFLRGYKRGIAMTGMKLLSHFPMVKKWAQPYIENNREKLAEVDQQPQSPYVQNSRYPRVAVPSGVNIRDLFHTACYHAWSYYSSVHPHLLFHHAVCQHAVLHATAVGWSRGRIPYEYRGSQHDRQCRYLCSPACARS